jgi:hypothetical protein
LEESKQKKAAFRVFELLDPVGQAENPVAVGLPSRPGV